MVKTTILIEGNPIPVDRLVATYTPRHGLKTPPTLLLEWDGGNLFFTGKKVLTIWLGPRYKGLLDDIFKNRVLAEDFSLYLHAPTRTDPSLAPKGHECFYVLSPVPHLS